MSNDSTGSAMWWCIGAIIALGVVFATTVGTRDDAGALRAAERSGFQAPVLVEVSYWTQLSGCSKSDNVAYAIRATRDGAPVDLVVCGGWLKAFTVRVR